MNSATFDEGLLSVTQAAHYMGITRPTVYRLMEAGELPFTRVGRCRRIPKRSIINYLQRNMRPAGGEVSDE